MNKIHIDPTFVFLSVEYSWRLLMDTMNTRHTSPHMNNKPRFLHYMFYVYAVLVGRICMKTQVQSGRGNGASLND